MELKTNDTVRVVDSFFSTEDFLNLSQFNYEVIHTLKEKNGKITGKTEENFIVSFDHNSGHNVNFLLPEKYLEKVKVKETLVVDKDDLIRIVEMAYVEGRQRFWKPGDSTGVIADYKHSHTYNEFLELCKKLKINYERLDYDVVEN